MDAAIACEFRGVDCDNSEPRHVELFHVGFDNYFFVNNLKLTNSAQDYTPTPLDHSLNTYGITPHAAVKQPIYKNS